MEPLLRGVAVQHYGLDPNHISDFEKLFDKPPPNLVKDAFDQFLITMESNEKDACKLMHQALFHKKFRNFESNLIKLLGKIKPEALRKLLELLIKEPLKTSIEVIKNCIQMVNEDTLRISVGDWLTEDQIENAITILEENGKKVAASKQKDALIADINKKPYSPGMVETLLTAYSFFSLDQIPVHPWEALQLLQVHLGILIIPFILSSAIDDLAKGESPFDRLNFFWWTIVAMVVFAIAMKIYKKYRPIPGVVKPLRTYTNEAEEGRFAPLTCREDVIRKVFTCWMASNDGTRPHPLLVGETGVGKTAIFTEIARRFVTGEIPESAKEKMKGKKMFGGSAASLLPTSSSPMPTDDTLDRVFKCLEPHKNDVVVCLDEVHTFWLEKHASSYGEIVKGIFDTSVKGFPFMLAATTPADYKKYIAIDPQRSRRFHVIKVDPTNEIQTILILRDMVKRFYPTVIVSDTVISQAFQLTTRDPKLKRYKQPDISKRVLSGAISSVQMKQSISRFDSIILAKIQERDLFLEKYTAEIDPKQAEKISKTIYEIKKEIEILEEQVKAFNEDKKKLDRLQKEYNEVQTLLLSLAQSIVELRKKRNNLLALQFKREFIFLKYFKLIALKKEIDELCTKLNLPSLEEELQFLISDFEKEEVNTTPDKTKGAPPTEKSSFKEPIPPYAYVSIVGHKFKVKNQQTYQVCHTMGDGACAIHGILGKLEGKTYFLKDARGVFVSTLQARVKEEIVLTRFNTILAGYVDEFFKTHDRILVDVQRRYLELLFNSMRQDLMEDYKTKLNQLEEQKKQLKILERQLIEEMVKEAKATNRLDDLAKLLDCKKELFDQQEPRFSKFKEDKKQEALLAFFKDIGPKYKENQEALKLINRQCVEFSRNFVEEHQHSFHNAYFKICLDERYYLSDADISLIALLFKKRIEIYAASNRDQLSYEVGNEGELVVLYHRGIHYCRCEFDAGPPDQKIDKLPDKKE